MGRELRRVPLDFDWPLGAVWWGYIAPEPEYLFKHARAKETREELADTFFERWFKQTEPPKGDGYQLWETTSEGSPQSPVFKTLDELCEYAAEKCTVFADFELTAEEWREQFSNEKPIAYKDGNKGFI